MSLVLLSYPSSSKSAEEIYIKEASATFELKYDSVLYSDSSLYQLKDLIGEGTFGAVTMCMNVETGNMVAVKIHKNSQDMTIKDEIANLKALQAIDPDKNNIVRFIENFRFHEMSCLVFEMLDKSIWDLIKKRFWPQCGLSEIRPIAQQLLVALDALKSLGITHCDLKLDNIMLVNHSKQPYKIKLIDFGLALPESKMKVGMMVQILTYRAPEVNLGLSLTTAIDMWTLGCIMAHLYFGTPLFPSDCKYNWMKVMLHLLGQPDTNLLAKGKYTHKFHSLEQYKRHTDKMPHVSTKFFRRVESLDQAVLKAPRKPSGAENEDRVAFLNLLKCCLTVDARERITPREALNHSFITMSHLVGKSDATYYVKNAAQMMSGSHQPQNAEMTKQECRSDRESLPTVGERDRTDMDPPLWPSTAPSCGSDLQSFGSSGEKSDRPRSCQSGDSTEIYFSIDSDRECCSGCESEFYTYRDESDESVFLSSDTMSSYNDGNNGDLKTTTTAPVEPHNDIILQDISAPSSSARDPSDGQGNVAPPITDETGTTATVLNDSTNADNLSAGNIVQTYESPYFSCESMSSYNHERNLQLMTITPLEAGNDIIIPEISAPSSAARGRSDKGGNIAPPLPEESRTTATVLNVSVKAENVSAGNITNNGDSVATDPSDGAAGLTTSPEAVGVRTSPRRPWRKALGQKVCQVLNQVRKGLTDLLICGANKAV
ncbi:hypothetical protein Q5P01_020065 [Channa striata]|uniref:Protein kinase domain-containing protein n=1 Tax=Channa striata TaxID=64152 RepID=A0AA88SAZ8_CHASR|nr:hypothetical protein Q5P01_020065 [Channa striata]